MTERKRNELEADPAFRVYLDAGSAFDLMQQHPQLRYRVLRICGQSQGVALEPHEEVPAARFR